MDLLLQFVHFGFWSFMLFLIEYDLGKRVRRCYLRLVANCSRSKPVSETKIDIDVINEAKRVEEASNEELMIKVKNLRKVYNVRNGCCSAQTLTAVENLSFGLEAGEIFALLGVNGAGKSTTFKTLTSEVDLTSGSIHIGAHDIRSDFHAVKNLIGYCPQTNPIFDYMTVQENLEYFAKIKGVPAQRR